MFSHRPGRILLALGASLAFGWFVVLIAPPGLAASAAWPFGAVTGCALWCPLRGRVVILGVLALTLSAAYLTTGVEYDDAATAAAAHVAGVITTIVVLSRRGRPRATLLSEADVVRYVVAAAAGGLATTVVVGARLVLTDTDIGPSVAGFGLQHAASELLLVPFFVRQHVHRGSAGRLEWAAQWSIVAGSTALAFGPPHLGAGVFIILTALGWGARRLGTWESLAQATGVGMAATLLTLDQRGTFQLVAMTGIHGALARTADNLMLQAFVACIALIVVPLVLTVGVQLEALQVASQERDRVTGIVDGAPGLAVIGTDPDGVITLFNVGAERLLGYASEEAVGQPTTLLDPPGDRAGPDVLPGPYSGLSLGAAAHEGDAGSGRRVLLRRRDGEVRTFEGAVHVVRDSSQKAVGFVTMSEDISDRLLEQQSLEAAVARLREIDEAKDTFMSSVSHELRTPLASIVGYVEMLADGAFGPLTRAQDEALGRIAGNGGRLLGLIDDLLTFSRLGDEARPIAREAVELRQVVQAALEVVEPLLRPRDLELYFDVPAGPVDLIGDHPLLERLVINLIGNAVKFTPDGGRIEVAVERGEGTARVLISDTGIGIPADELPQLTSRFFRSRGAVREAIPGTGLGLSISRSIVEAHGGSIDISSVEGEGTSVRIDLPVGPMGPAGTRRAEVDHTPDGTECDGAAEDPGAAAQPGAVGQPDAVGVGGDPGGDRRPSPALAGWTGGPPLP